ncbi:glycoside hydrolase family 5 protein [Pedobacter sp. ISL-68]|uniref:glycoside hydrolase family 5 protein n=1 Tax=unclassified Pedobacter TaxID=2628915 RepID=UPI001BE5C856|nr:MULTISPECIES: glycoside hydrolase family 5 protein [unclassified Pedobacter]MBT2564094.1 glycoside hydrolase family 5 protein [Pedobacter sp. ISL-64]MBT2589772.1 glycoside hydrolase family 5 protein [Pedobacter sp. ISL-68]
MKRVLLLSVFAFSTIIVFAQSVNWVERNGALKVVDGKILNRKNIEPQLRGVSLSWSIWGGKKYYNQDVVNWLTSDFNINLLRVSMAVQPDNGYLQNPLGQEKLITETIDAAIKKNLYVLIDWHDHHADEHLDQSKMFFAKMAKRYTGKPNIIYEIFNEPEKIAWQTVKDYAVQVIAEIRKYDAENVIVVGSPHWDQDIDVVAKDPIKGFSNIAYSFHFYASEPSHQEVLMRRADNAISAGLPIFVTEWGVGEANGDGIFDTSKTNKWFSWMEKNKLSWANWNITDKKETTALLMPGASPKGKWKPEMLSPAGKYIRAKLRKLNK